jgi:hypothetical protein
LPGDSGPGRILAAAHDPVRPAGCATTTSQQVAKQADVAWQTVYSVFGIKAAIPSAVFDVAVADDDKPVPVPERPFMQSIKDLPILRPPATYGTQAHARRACSASSKRPPAPIPR